MGLGSGVWGFGVTVGRLGVGVEEWVVAVGVRVAVGVGEAVAVVGVRVAAVGEGDAAGVGWRIGGADGWFGIAEAWAGVVDAKIGSADGWFDIADGWRCAVIARWVYGRGRKSAAGMKVVGGTAEVGVAQASSPASLGGVSPPVPTRGETSRELGGGTPAVPRCDATVAGGGLGEDFRLLTSAATGRGTTGEGRRAWDDGRGLESPNFTSERLPKWWAKDKARTGWGQRERSAAFMPLRRGALRAGPNLPRHGQVEAA